MKRITFDKRFINNSGNDLIFGKIHTIRQSYDYWKKFEGKEVALFTWEGKPYQKGSKQKIFCIKKIFHVQELDFTIDKTFNLHGGETSAALLKKLAKNDGFNSLPELYSWFLSGDYKPRVMAIIHFTDFRY